MMGSGKNASSRISAIAHSRPSGKESTLAVSAEQRANPVSLAAFCRAESQLLHRRPFIPLSHYHTAIEQLNIQVL
jgi:hypothetical protein